MKYETIYSIYGIDKKDFRILKSIKDKGKSSLQISKDLEIPRPTVLFRLNKMKDRNLVLKTGKRPNIYWTGNHLQKDGLLKNTSSDIKIHSGIEQVKIVWMKILEDLNGKLYFLETPHLFNAIETKFSEAFLLKCRKTVIDKKIIQEGITPRSSLMKNNGGKYIDKNKMMSWTIVPDEYIDFHDSFIVRDGLVFIINLKKEIIIEIKNHSLEILIISMIKNLSKFGKKISFAKAVEEADD